MEQHIEFCKGMRMSDGSVFVDKDDVFLTREDAAFFVGGESPYDVVVYRYVTEWQEATETEGRYTP